MKQLLLLILLIPICLYSQDFEIDTYNPDNSSYQISKYSDIVLEKNKKYKIKVEGTYSPWGMSSWLNPCGDYEGKPIYSSHNRGRTYVGHDFFYSFGYPNNCKHMEFPRKATTFELSLDEGKTWFTPNIPDYQKNHIYYFELIGEGKPLWIKNKDRHSSDNNGIFKINAKKIKEEKKEIKVDEKREKEGIDNDNTTLIPNINLNIFPNPSQGKLNLEFDKPEFSGNAIIYDAQGKIVKEVKINGNQMIIFSTIPSGVYFIKVIGENGNSETLKFINIQPIT